MTLGRSCPRKPRWWPGRLAHSTWRTRPGVRRERRGWVDSSAAIHANLVLRTFPRNRPLRYFLPLLSSLTICTSARSAIAVRKTLFLTIGEVRKSFKGGWGVERVGSNGPWSVHSLHTVHWLALQFLCALILNVMSRDIQTHQSERCFVKDIHSLECKQTKMDDIVQLECQLDAEIQTYKDQVRPQPLLKLTDVCSLLFQ